MILAEAIMIWQVWIPYWGDGDHLENNRSGKRGQGALKYACCSGTGS
jgi:hypothetical protein